MADSNNDLEIRLKFIIDQQSQAAANAAIKNVGKTSGGASTLDNFAMKLGVPPEAFNELKSYRAEYEKLVAQGSKMPGMDFLGGFFNNTEKFIEELSNMPTEEVYKKFNDAQPAITQLRHSLESTKKDFAAVTDSADQTARAVKAISLQTAGESLNRFGMGLTRLSQSLLSPIDTYLQSAGSAAGIGAEWTKTNQKIENSMVRIGGVMAREVLPTLEKAANVADKVASIIEANPQIAKAAASFAIGAGVIGTVASGFGQTVSAISGISVLLNGLKAGGAASGAVGAATAAGKIITADSGMLFAGGSSTAAVAATGLKAVAATVGEAIAAIATPLAGLALGIKGFDALKPKEWDDGLTTIKKAIALDASALVGFVAGADKAREAFIFMAEKLGLMGDQAKKANEAGKVNITPQMVDAWEQFQNAEQDAAKNYARATADIKRDESRSVATENTTYNRNRANLINQAAQEAQQAQIEAQRQQTELVQRAAQEDQQAEQRYYQERSKLVAESSQQDIEAEQEHQRRIQQINEDSNDRLIDLADKRDALAMVRELRDAEKQRRREEESYNAETAQRNRQLAQRLAEMDQEFTQERQQRREELARKLAEAQQEAAYEAQQRQAQLQQRLSELDSQHQQELAQIHQQAADKLNDLNTTYQQERADRKRALDEQLSDLGAFGQQETEVKRQILSQQLQMYLAAQNQMRASAQATPATSGGAGAAAYSGPTGTSAGGRPNTPQTGTNVFQGLANTFTDWYKKVTGHAVGGWSVGLTNTGENGPEWILDNPTSKLAERLTNGRMSQQSISNLMLRGAQSGGNNITINQRIDGRISATEIRGMRKEVNGWLAEAFS